MHSQINRAVNESYLKFNILWDQCPQVTDTESGSSGSGQKNNEQANSLKTKKTKKDYMSAIDLRNTGNLSAYTNSLILFQSTETKS